MKTLILFAFIWIGMLKSGAQNLNVAHHSYVDDVHGLASINGKNFYLERIVSNTVLDSANLVGINESGKIIFKKNFNYNEGNYAQNVHKTSDKRLIVYGFSNGCIADKDPKNFILKIDTNGVAQASNTSQYMVNGSLARFIDFVEHPDSSYYFLTDSLLFHYNKTLQFISVIAHGLVYAKAMTLTISGNLLIHGKTSSLVIKNREITPAGVLVNVQNGALDLRQIRQAQSGNYYGLAVNGTIEKLNASLQTVGNSSVAIAPTDFRAFAIRKDTIFFADVNNSNNPVYGMMDESFSVLYISPSVYMNIYPRAMTINNRNKINIIAAATSSIGTNNTFVSFFQFPRNGSFVANPDIGVATFSITNTLLYTQYSSYLSVNLDVTVRNYSNDTVRGFCLNAPGKQLACGFDQFHKQYQNHIPPNGTVLVQTGTFSYPLTGTVTQVPGFLFSNNICIYTTVPDSKNDININNDHFCQAVALRVGLTENEADDQSVNIFPNPFSEEFTIKSDSHIKSLKIYDAYGKLIRQFSYNDKEVNVPTDELSEGIYLVRIETEKGSRIKKGIKH